MSTYQRKRKYSSISTDPNSPLESLNHQQDFDSKLYTKTDGRYQLFSDSADFFREDDCADKWFNELTRVHAAIGSSRSSGPSNFRPVKVAILDTGLCWQHPEFKEHIQRGSINKTRCRAFPATLDPCDDKHGHGTHAASVLLQTAPDIELYIARVADDTGNIIKDNDYDGVINV
jgi:Subtilase family